MINQQKEDSLLNELIDTASEISKKILENDELKVIVEIHKLINNFTTHDTKLVQLQIMWLIKQSLKQDDFYMRQIINYMSYIYDRGDSDKDTSNSRAKKCKTSKNPLFLFSPGGVSPLIYP